MLAIRDWSAEWKSAIRSLLLQPKVPSFVMPSSSAKVEMAMPNITERNNGLTRAFSFISCLRKREMFGTLSRRRTYLKKSPHWVLISFYPTSILAAETIPDFINISKILAQGLLSEEITNGLKLINYSI